MIYTNTTLRQIGEELFGAKSVLLFPHESPDGDAIGSCVALCRALRRAGIDCWVLIDEKLPELIAFIDEESGSEEQGGQCCTTDFDAIKDPDICAFIDCCGLDRIQGREDKFKEGRKSICIDHHSTSKSEEDLYYIDGENSAATTQIIYRILREMGVEIDKEIANPIYTGICTDTGNFKYANTTAETHRIASELMQAGIDHYDIMIKLYQCVDIRQVKVENAAFSNMELFADGKAAITCVPLELLDECGALPEHADNLINVLRDINGVEVATVLKERTPGITKVSFRSKTTADVSAISAAFGGGGHAKSAGCTLKMDIPSAKAVIMEAVEAAIGKAK